MLGLGPIAFAVPWILGALIVLPVLGLTETPLPQPESISAPVLSHPANVPAGAAAKALASYRRQLQSGWKRADIPVPPLTRGAFFQNGGVWFAVAVADRPEGAWTGLVVVTNSYWDTASRDALIRCRAG